MTDSTPFHDDRLTPQENKAAEMALNGFALDEIAEELEISNNHASVLLNKARQKGIVVWAKPSSRRGWETAALQELRDKGLTYAQISERTGISINSITVRLWKARKRAGQPIRERRANRSKWSDSIVSEWMREMAMGKTSREIAERVGVSRNAILGAVWKRRRKSLNQLAERAA